MTGLVVDASVWVSAADASDPFSSASRTFLDALARQRTPIALPAIARLEVACALARRLRDPQRGRQIAERTGTRPALAPAGATWLVQMPALMEKAKRGALCQL